MDEFRSIGVLPCSEQNKHATPYIIIVIYIVIYIYIYIDIYSNNDNDSYTLTRA